ncbi:MAG: hypothetical protein OXG72_21110 [Acidobacteria bacterium]|nr:hypothetical protein [Acidobacteriota bacterium]
MPTQDSLFDLFETAPEEPEPAETHQPPAAEDREVQRRIDALVPCRSCPHRTSPEWAAFSGGLCMACSPLESHEWFAERKRAQKKQP